MLFLSHTDIGRHDECAPRGGRDDVRVVAELRQPGQLWLGIAIAGADGLMEGDFATAETILGEESDSGSYFTLAHDNVSAVAHAPLPPAARAGTSGGGRVGGARVGRRVPVVPVASVRARTACSSTWAAAMRRARFSTSWDAMGSPRSTPTTNGCSAWAWPAEAAARLGASRGGGGAVCCSSRRYAGRHAIGHAEGSIGAVDRYLGLLAATLGPAR